MRALWGQTSSCLFRSAHCRWWRGGCIPGPPKILVVDEDTHNPDQIGLWLRQEGFEVLQATSALTAPNLAHNAHPDALVLPTAPPGKEGLEVCRRLREASDASILCLALEGGMKDAVGALEAGAEDYTLSPHVREDVLARLKTCLRRRSRRRPSVGGREPDEPLWLTDPPPSVPLGGIACSQP